MHHALFEILTGEYASGRAISNIASNYDITVSIKDHLTRLLNARLGAMEHLPDYGLPDISYMYQKLPYSLDDMVGAIRKSILKYEPRLKQVDVLYKPMSGMDCILHLAVNARLASGQYVQFETYFMSGGYARVEEGAIKN
ncbi:MAG: type VI secretion system baseplate subunit TssE [Thiohalomonadales bacterium]